MTAADLFGHKAHPTGRILDAVLHDVCHLKRKPKAHVQLLQFRLAGITNQFRVGGKKIGEQLTYNPRHVVAVFVQVLNPFQRKPAGAKGSLLPKGKLGHALAHFHSHRPHRSGKLFRKFLQQGYHHMGMEAQVHIGVIRTMPAFGQGLLKSRNRLVRQVGRLEDSRKQSQHNVLAGSRHLGVVFYGIGNAQVQVGKQDTLVQATLEHVNVQCKRPRNLQQDIFGVLPSRTPIQDVLTYTYGI